MAAVKKRPRRKHSEEFKIEAVRQYWKRRAADPTFTRGAMASELDVVRNLFDNWVARYSNDAKENWNEPLRPLLPSGDAAKKPVEGPQQTDSEDLADWASRNGDILKINDAEEAPSLPEPLESRTLLSRPEPPRSEPSSPAPMLARRQGELFVEPEEEPRPRPPIRARAEREVSPETADFQATALGTALRERDAVLTTIGILLREGHCKIPGVG